MMMINSRIKMKRWSHRNKTNSKRRTRMTMKPSLCTIHSLILVSMNTGCNNAGRYWVYFIITMSLRRSCHLFFLRRVAKSSTRNTSHVLNNQWISAQLWIKCVVTNTLASNSTRTMLCLFSATANNLINHTLRFTYLLYD